MCHDSAFLFQVVLAWSRLVAPRGSSYTLLEYHREPKHFHTSAELHILLRLKPWGLARLLFSISDSWQLMGTCPIRGLVSLQRQPTNRDSNPSVQQTMWMVCTQTRLVGIVQDDTYLRPTSHIPVILCQNLRAVRNCCHEDETEHL